jgi:ion channel-forming bestrophin family protein
MIVTEDIRVSRVLRITWKTDLLVLASCLGGYFANEYILSKYFLLPAMIPTVIGTALAFFIGFNNNQAYSRWWEARQIWGSLVNNSRSWARGILSYSHREGSQEGEIPSDHKAMIYRHIAFLYALKAALRNQEWESYKQYLPPEEVEIVEKKSNKHNAILHLQSRSLESLYQEGCIDGFKFLHLNDMLVTFADDMGKSERIKNTVFPTTYLYFTRLFIWLFSIIITIVASETTGIWAVALGSIVSFVFHTTHIIGVSLLNPFEPQVTGISLDQITRTIEINLLEMLGESDIPPAIKPIGGEYVM